jgi:hypothetical protein
MQLFHLLASLDPEVVPERCKIHLASWNGIVDPLDVYLAGEFDEWQMGQNQRNFERPLVLSLIELDRAGRWLFAGMHDANGCVWRDDLGNFHYALERRPTTDELDGRLVVSFKRPGRQSYLRAEKWADGLLVDSIRPERLAIGAFPGYAQSLLTKQHLDIVVRQQIESWRSALSAVGGVYVIVDRATGRMYVGSATAGEGIWSRWSDYSRSGHGGNKELRRLLAEKGEAYAENFQFGVLEIADMQASQQYVVSRECYWKDLLQTRTHGYNAN